MFFSNGVVRNINDEWTGATPDESQGMTWTGLTIFTQQDAPAPVLEPGQPGAGLGGVRDGSSSASSGGRAAGTFDPKLIDTDKPWDGDTPPVPLPGAGFDLKFERRPDGVWCRRRGNGMYPVDRNGEQWNKSRVYKPDGSINYDRKPPEINASFWWGKFSNVARKKYWTALWEEQPHLKPPRQPKAAGESGQPDEPKARAAPTVCTAPGIYAFFDDKDEGATAWRTRNADDELTDCPATDEEDGLAACAEDSSDEEYLACADQPDFHYQNVWEKFIEQGSFAPPTANRASPAEAATDESGQPGASLAALPCRQRRQRERHRTKVTTQRRFPFNALVARPVGKQEIANTPKAQDAMNAEWGRLRQQTVWDEDHPREWDDVRKEAQRGKYDVHLGWLFGICVQKNSELAGDDPANKFKRSCGLPGRPGD